MITGSKTTREREASAPVHLDTTMITRIKTRRERPASAPVHLDTAMTTRSKTRREREASAPVHFDTEDLGHGMSWSNISTPNGKARKSNFGGQKHERQDQQLLPGIPDEITLDLITPKLPWITFYTLQSVSSSWRRVIQSRQIYNARCRALATEALIIISPFSELANYGKYSDPPSIGLYSMREEKIYRLPGIGRSTGIPHRCQSISLDGKVYVMGGYSSPNRKACGDMYVLDLITSKCWKRCASMKNGRADFGCCIVDGRIFVCGGRAGGRHCKNSALDTSLLEPEIYDPQLDLWSSLKPMRYFRIGNQVAVLGDEIFVHGGRCYRPTRPCRDDAFFHASSEIYNPILDEWRTVEDPMLNSKECRFRPLFVTQGKIHSIEHLWRAGWQVQVYDSDKKSWSKSSSFSLDHDDSLDMCGDMCRNFGEDVITPLVVDDEIVRIVAQRDGDGNFIHRLIHRSRFSVQRKITACQTARTPFLIDNEFLPSRMSIIRLCTDIHRDILEHFSRLHPSTQHLVATTKAR